MERAKTLIVDDDPTLRRALKIRLRASHYDTVQASDGHSAIAMAQREQPGLYCCKSATPARASLKRIATAAWLPGVDPSYQTSCY